MKSQREILGENLQKLIDRKRIDQKILAEKIGVSEMTVSNWVRGIKYPRIDKIQAMADYFNVKKSDLIEEKSTKKSQSITTQTYPYLPISISAGAPIEIDALSEDDLETISIPDAVMGKWAGRSDIFIMRVNGDSMNKVIPHHSLIAVKKVDLPNLNNDDIVVYSDGVSYAVKHFINDKANERLIFRPDSTDSTFTEHIVPYEEAHKVRIHGKVVIYVVERD